MNKIIKKFFNYVCAFLTYIVNQGQRVVCWKESKDLYKSLKDSDTPEVREQFKKNKSYLKQFGLKAVKRDFYVFYKYLSSKGHDPAKIIPTVIVNNYVTPVLNPVVYSPFFEDKNMFDKILPVDMMPQTLLRRIGGVWYKADYSRLDCEVTRYLDRLEAEPGIVIKPTLNTSSGKGVELYERRGGKWINKKTGRPLCYDDLASGAGSDDLIIQEAVSQSEFLNTFCDTAVNTLRIVIYNSPIDGECHLIWGGLKIGAKGEFVDNAHAGGIVFGLNRNGKLAAFGMDQHGNKFSVFNGVDFEKGEYLIPDYDGIVRFAKEAASMLLPHRFISFDVALDQQDKPKIIEFNIRGYSGWYCQFAGDYMLGEKTDEILRYVTRNKSKGKKFFYRVN